MSFLSPLFLLGALAIALPLWLHLQNRRTREERPWSSLRFLIASSPRLERRRRVEHWLLLAARVAIVTLLALAFARPLLMRAGPLPLAAVGVRRLVLVDVSASMQRRGLWAEATARVRRLLAAAEPGDRVALMTFADRAQVRLGFEEWAAAPSSSRAGLAEARLATLSPGFGGTDLGAALVGAAEVMAEDAAGPGGRVARAEVLLVSDLTEGTRLEALGPAEWPAELALHLERIAGAPGGNVGLAPVPVGEGDEPLRVRVSASGGAVDARLGWAEGGDSVAVHLEPGESRVVTAPARAEAGTLVVTGDDEDFDNRLVVVPPVAAPSRIVYVGEGSPADAQSGLYFLSRAFPRTRARAPEVLALRPGDAGVAAAIARADLVVLAAGVAPPALRDYLARGRTLLFVPPDAAAGAALAQLTGAALPAWREAPAREAVLTAVEVAHPLLQPFTERGAGDFSRIRFWRHRVAELGEGARVLARFDDGSPAWALVAQGRGQIFVMTSGFDPRDSQLGLSSKLVPLLFGLLDASAGAAADLAPRFVGQPLPLPAGREALTIARPDGAWLTLPTGAARYDDVDRPGVYQITRKGEPPRRIAVNLPPAESATAPLPLEALERAGIRLGPGQPVASTARGAAHVRATQAEVVEAAQRPWRWLLVAVLLLVAAESALALRAGRRREAQA